MHFVTAAESLVQFLFQNKQYFNSCFFLQEFDIDIFIGHIQAYYEMGKFKTIFHKFANFIGSG